jgi:hypothetical protein
MQLNPGNATSLARARGHVSGQIAKDATTISDLPEIQLPNSVYKLPRFLPAGLSNGCGCGSGGALRNIFWIMSEIGSRNLGAGSKPNQCAVAMSES